jgi:hypothetical protein
MWELIETYDAIPDRKKPKLAIFRFAPVVNVDRPYASLAEAFKTERHMGNRVCTHWVRVPEFTE